MINNLDVEGIALKDAEPQGANKNAPMVRVRLRVTLAGATTWPVVQGWRPGPVTDALLEVREGHRVCVKGAIAQASGYNSKKSGRVVGYVTANDPQQVQVFDDSEEERNDEPED